MRITLKAVNTALKLAGINAEILRGECYFYFFGPDFDTVPCQGVYGVYRLSDLSVEQWVREAKNLIGGKPENKYDLENEIIQLY